MEEEKNYCPHCNGEIMPGARKCKHCGEFLDESLKEDRAPRVPRRAGPPPSNGAATAALILGIIGLFLQCLSVVAIILGFVGLANAKKHPSRPGQGAAMAGLILGFVGVLLMVVVVAAIAIPSLLASKQAANEFSAIASLRTLQAVQEVYAAKHDTYADLDGLVAERLIDPVFGAAVDTQHTKNGYYFRVEASAGRYSCTAMPAVPGSTGSRSFYMGEDGVIYERSCRSSNDPPADANSPTLGGSGPGRPPW